MTPLFFLILYNVIYNYLVSAKLVLGRNASKLFHTGVVQGTNSRKTRYAGTVSNDYIGTERMPGSGCGTSLRGIIIPMTSFSVISSIRRILSGCQRANDVMTRTDFIGCSCINCIYWRNLNGKY